MLSEVGEAFQALSWLGKSNRLRLKIVTKGNGKDVLWSTYTLRITNSENFIRLTRQQMRAFRRGRGGGTLVTEFTALSHWSCT